MAKPLALPNLSFSTKVEALMRVEHHDACTTLLFLKLHLYPFIEKGLMLGKDETHERNPPHVLGQLHGHHAVR